MSLLSLSPVKLSNTPSSQELLVAARELIESTTSWTQQKVYNGVRTYTTKSASGPAWFCRVSEHSSEDATFDELWQGLGVNHSLNEKEYIPDLASVVLITTIEPGISEVWSLHYNLGVFVSNRTFTEVVVTHLEEASPGMPKTGWVISIPFDTSEKEEFQILEPKGVRGKYASVERLLQLDDGRVEWRMAVCSTAGGLIPHFIGDLAIPGQIAKDVPYVLAWLKKRREQSQ